MFGLLRGDFGVKGERDIAMVCLLSSGWTPFNQQESMLHSNVKHGLFPGLVLKWYASYEEFVSWKMKT